LKISGGFWGHPLAPKKTKNFGILTMGVVIFSETQVGVLGEDNFYTRKVTTARRELGHVLPL